MASPALIPSSPYRRLSLATIDAVVSARLGPARIQGNAQPACFNRQVAMYLAKHVAGWSTTCIGRFYNGRDHSTVIQSIQRIQALRETDPEIDALIAELKDQLARNEHEAAEERTFEARNKIRPAVLNLANLADAIAERVWARIKERLQEREAP